MDQSFYSAANTSPVDWIAEMYEIDTSGGQQLVDSIPVDFPHNVTQTWTFTNLNQVSHIMRLYEYPGGVKGLLLAELQVQPNSVGVSALKRLELEVGAGLDIVPNQDAFDGTATYPDYAGLVAGVDYNVHHRSYGLLKSNEYTNNDDTGVTFGFKVTADWNSGQGFQDGETYWIDPIPSIQVNPANFSGGSSGGGIKGYKEIAADTNLDSSYNNNIIALAGSASVLNVGLNYLSAVPALTTFRFIVDGTSGQKFGRLFAKPGEEIHFNGITANEVFLGIGENMDLLRVVSGLTTFYKALNVPYQFNMIGRAVADWNTRPNTVVADGSELLRSEYPRLWNYVNTLPLGKGLVSETTWQANNTYKTSFSQGDGTTTFRVPNLLGVYFRMIDNSRGFDPVRVARALNEAIGSYVEDQLLQHSHTGNVTPDDRPGRSDNANDRDVMIPGGNGRQYSFTTSTVGGPENRVKDVAFLPLIFT